MQNDTGSGESIALNPLAASGSPYRALLDIQSEETLLEELKNDPQAVTAQAPAASSQLDLNPLASIAIVSDFQSPPEGDRAGEGAPRARLLDLSDLAAAPQGGESAELAEPQLASRAEEASSPGSPPTPYQHKPYETISPSGFIETRAACGLIIRRPILASSSQPASLGHKRMDSTASNASTESQGSTAPISTTAPPVPAGSLSARERLQQDLELRLSKRSQEHTGGSVLPAKANHPPAPPQLETPVPPLQQHPSQTEKPKPPPQQPPPPPQQVPPPPQQAPPPPQQAPPQQVPPPPQQRPPPFHQSPHPPETAAPPPLLQQPGQPAEEPLSQEAPPVPEPAPPPRTAVPAPYAPQPLHVGSHPSQQSAASQQHPPAPRQRPPPPPPEALARHSHQPHPPTITPQPPAVIQQLPPTPPLLSTQIPLSNASEFSFPVLKAQQRPPEPSSALNSSQPTAANSTPGNQVFQFVRGGLLVEPPADRHPQPTPSSTTGSSPKASTNDDQHTNSSPSLSSSSSPASPSSMNIRGSYWVDTKLSRWPFPDQGGRQSATTPGAEAAMAARAAAAASQRASSDAISSSYHQHVASVTSASSYNRHLTRPTPTEQASAYSKSSTTGYTPSATNARRGDAGSLTLRSAEEALELLERMRGAVGASSFSAGSSAPQSAASAAAYAAYVASTHAARILTPSYTSALTRSARTRSPTSHTTTLTDHRPHSVRQPLFSSPPDPQTFRFQTHSSLHSPPADLRSSHISYQPSPHPLGDTQLTSTPFQMPSSKTRAYESYTVTNKHTATDSFKSYTHSPVASTHKTSPAQQEQLLGGKNVIDGADPNAAGMMAARMKHMDEEIRWLGESVVDQDRQLALKDVALEDSETRIAEQNRSIAMLQARIQQLEETAAHGHI